MGSPRVPGGPPLLLHTSSRPLATRRETLTGENQPSPGLLLRRSTRVELEVWLNLPLVWPYGGSSVRPFSLYIQLYSTHTACRNALRFQDSRNLRNGPPRVVCSVRRRSILSLCSSRHARPSCDGTCSWRWRSSIAASSQAVHQSPWAATIQATKTMPQEFRRRWRR